MDPQELLSLCKRRGFLWPAYDIYGSVAGLYDYGPLGAALKNNIEDHWRRLYVQGEGFQEISCPIVAPEPVFKASGHVDAFSDMYVECTKCGETFRADHLAAGLHANPASLGEDELGKMLRESGVLCPECGGGLTAPKRFNLMFKTSIGAGRGKTAYLRPETAQGMFVNFSQVYRYGREKLPVGAVQIGRAFRNEISPRQGLIRLRELNMMEAELFVHPEDKSWPKFRDVRAEVVPLVPNKGPPSSVALEEAVKAGVIRNEVLAYFMWLTYKFALDIGLDPKRLRFRQHESTEMAHYASDCWDLEAEIGYGWTELVGVADRGCFDVKAHLDHSGADLTSFERYDEPREVEMEVVKPNFGALGPLFKDKSKLIAEALSKLPAEAAKDQDKVTVDVEGEALVVPSSCYEVSKRKEKVSGRKLVPHVIEPSYGVDRLLFSLLDHVYSKKDEYIVLRLKGLVAPIKVGVFPLMARDGLGEIATSIFDSLVKAGIAAYYDDSGSIGRRYARMDEIGTPCCVTVDYDTKSDGTVTVRDRDSAEQVRVKKEEVAEVVKALISGASFESLRSPQD
ncbi:MAG: glycine--tRNA ligase [Candidatus Thermoplasmatota archaeon]|nr:glycine--tRNA ligase [Candidatus Thermoplasmatota archaeon]